MQQRNVFVEYIWEDIEKRKGERSRDVLVRRPIVRNNAQFMLFEGIISKGESCSSCKTIDRNTTVENSTRLRNILPKRSRSRWSPKPNPNLLFDSFRGKIIRCMFSVFREWTINTSLHCKTRKLWAAAKRSKNSREPREKRKSFFFLFFFPLASSSSRFSFHTSSHFDLGCQPLDSAVSTEFRA